MGTSSSRSSFVSEYYTRGDYIPGIQVDGNCVISVREAAKFAVQWTKSGKVTYFSLMERLFFKKISLVTLLLKMW